MIEFISIFILIALSFTAIAIGVIFQNKPISGSCGGMSNLEDGASCQICGRTKGGCEE